MRLCEHSFPGEVVLSAAFTLFRRRSRQAPAVQAPITFRNNFRNRSNSTRFRRAGQAACSIRIQPRSFDIDGGMADKLGHETVGQGEAVPWFVVLMDV